MHVQDMVPIWVRPRRACEIGGFGITKCYELMNNGRLVTRKVDGMRLVSVASIERLGTESKPEAV